ncbi:MAG TPA: LamG domain-containing protein [Planctomycetes bacterium]|nr:LamG domain-containing protein [Planctomycetota bacterium]HIJ71511.1 LamG domain-containing protein [Planctomycetota bacterium]
MKQVTILMSLVLLVMCSLPVFGAGTGPVAWWKFDDIEVKRVEVKMIRGETFVPREKLHYVTESVSGEKYDLFSKYFEVVPGVSGDALLLDGYTTYVEVPAEKTEEYRVTDDFTVEAWIALGAYPKNLCPILDHQVDVADGYYNGFFFGLDANGRLILRIASNGRNEVLFSSKTIKLNEWTHVAGVYEGNVLTVYINGKADGSLRAVDGFDSHTDADHEWVPLLLFKSRGMHRPYGTIRPEGTKPVHTYLDGIVDEVKLYDEALSPRDVDGSYNDNKPSAKPQLPKRILPAGPEGTGKFGAINTHLKYYPGWDAPWHVGDNTDVVVRFDETPCRFVLWRGTNYIPHWVSEGIWFNNGFNEGWNEHGSCEPMSDKRCLYSYTKIVESNDARVVVLWRYGLVDNWGQFAFVEPLTGWGDWTEETFTIYPDMVGVREDKLFSNAPRAAHEWQESMMVMSPGQRPDEVLEFEALSLANMEGQTHTYSWEHEIPPGLPEEPANANIQVVNTKSKYRPFSAIRPQDEDYMDIYAGEIRRDVCVFPWWNHWPVAPRPTDGRYAMHDDRASHASLSHWSWKPYETTDNTMTKIMLNGLTTKKVDELIPLVKSWSNPAQLKLSGTGYTSDGYDPTQMAYVLNAKTPGQAQEVLFKLEASSDSPVINPAFVIKGWGFSDACLKIDGAEIKRGKNCRFGHRDRLEATDLIVWVRTESTKPLEISVSPK